MAFTSLSYSFLYFSTNSPSSFFFCQTILSLTSNKCFSHFNVQQLSNLKHKSFCFVFTSSFKNNIENENIRKNLFHSILLNYVLHCSIFFGARLEIPKTNKRGVLITAGGRGEGGHWIFFQEK